MIERIHLKLLQPMWQALKHYLFKDSPRESAAVLLCNESCAKDRRTLLAQSLIIPTAEDYTDQEPSRVGFTRSFLKKILGTCASEALHPVMCHSHPFVEKNVCFSATDDSWDGEFCAYTASRLPEMIHASLVMGNASCDARYYNKRKRRLDPIERIRIVGQGIESVITTSALAPSIPDVMRFDRQRPIFGDIGQALFGDLDVTIVGCGGTGSVVALQLAYLGVEAITLIDADHVEPTNRNRLLGATPRDAVRATPKPKVLRREIKRISPKTKVRIFIGKVEDAAELLKCADVIIGCVDADRPRHFYSRFPAQYYTPVIDVAVGIGVGDEKVSELHGQVRLILPEGPCLSCMRAIDPERLHRELLSATARENERMHGYGAGDDLPSPAVISLNATLASLAVTEFMNLIGRFRDPAQCIHYDGMSIDRVACGIAMGTNQECPICGPDVLGAGDSKSLPNYANHLQTLPPRKEHGSE